MTAGLARYAGTGVKHIQYLHGLRMGRAGEDFDLFNSIDGKKRYYTHARSLRVHSWCNV